MYMYTNTHILHMHHIYTFSLLIVDVNSSSLNPSCYYPFVPGDGAVDHESLEKSRNFVFRKCFKINSFKCLRFINYELSHGFK